MKRQYIIGLIFAGSIALLYWGINFIKGMDVFSAHRVYYAEYDNVSGLLVSSPVTASGFKIGHVTDISFKTGEPGLLVVKFIITEDLDIPDNTVAQIESSDLLGTKAIALHLGNSSVYAKSGSYLSGKVEASLKEEVSMQMLPLKMKVESLISSFDSALVVVQYIFDENTRENISKSIESIKYTVQNLEKTSSTIDTLLQFHQYKIGNIISNVEAITLNIRNKNKEISNIITNLSSLSDTLLLSNIHSVFDNASRSMKELSEITEKINSGEGSFGLLLENDSLYVKLHKASMELHFLLEDLKLNPERYLHFSIFGRKSKKQKYTPKN